MGLYHRKYWLNEKNGMTEDIHQNKHNLKNVPLWALSSANLAYFILPNCTACYCEKKKQQKIHMLKNNLSWSLSSIELRLIQAQICYDRNSFTLWELTWYTRFIGGLCYFGYIITKYNKLQGSSSFPCGFVFELF